jgi:hypothetical protein
MIRTILLALLCLYPAAMLTASDYSEQIRVATVNGGVITNTYKNTKYDLSLKDSGMMTGLYLQWINTKRFQVNFFGYYAPDVNYSRVFGYHANGDVYYLNNYTGSFVTGLDFEGLNINMDAGDHISGLEKFTMKNKVLFMMMRAGYKFKVNSSGNVSLSLFPYAGATRESVWGNIVLNPSGPPAYTPEMKIDISDHENFLSWGVNLSVKLFHFTEFTGKYLARQKDGGRLDSFSFQTNLYLPWNVAVSYQYKNMDLTSGKDIYHLFGVGMYF